MLVEFWEIFIEWWHLRKASRCARCTYNAPRRLLKRSENYVVDCMGCDTAGVPGPTRASAVRSWNTDNRRAP